MDVATEDNMQELVWIGEGMLAKTVSKVDMETGKPVAVPQGDQRRCARTLRRKALPGKEGEDDDVVVEPRRARQRVVS